MSDITITDQDFKNLDDKVVLMTGGSSGIGLCTAKILLSKGAKVINGDLSDADESSTTDISSKESFHFIKTDVTQWSELNALFKKTLDLYGRIDHVFANAGTGPAASYIDLALDGEGEPLEPTFRTLDINLRGCINTATLAVHYMKKQKVQGSIVLTASSSCFSRFSAPDYGMSKHGVLGLLRGLTPTLHPHLPIRINALCPSWTISGIVPKASLENTGAITQESSAPAKAAVLLMCDEQRHGQMILSAGNKYREIEEEVLLKAMTPEVRGQDKSEDEILVGVYGWLLREAEKKEKKESK